MKTLCIVPCGSKKIWEVDPHAGAMPAGKVYIGSFSKKCQDYAIKFYPRVWVILSAKYGFLRPDELIPGPYNVSFNDPVTNPINIRDLVRIADTKKLLNIDEVVVLAGKNYVQMVKYVFRGKIIRTPLSDCAGMGYMMQKMNDAIIKGKPI